MAVLENLLKLFLIVYSISNELLRNNIKKYE